MSFPDAVPPDGLAPADPVAARVGRHDAARPGEPDQPDPPSFAQLDAEKLSALLRVRIAEPQCQPHPIQYGSALALYEFTTEGLRVRIIHWPADSWWSRRQHCDYQVYVDGHLVHVAPRSHQQIEAQLAQAIGQAIGDQQRAARRADLRAGRWSGRGHW